MKDEPKKNRAYRTRTKYGSSFAPRFFAKNSHPKVHKKEKKKSSEIRGTIFWPVLVRESRPVRYHWDARFPAERGAKEEPYFVLVR